MRTLMAVWVVLAVACGGGEGGQQESQSPAAGAGAQAAPTGEPTGTVHEVEMLLTDDGQYIYRPAELTIKVGDTVRWLNVSGFPHNVAFYGDRIPDGASEYLPTVMPAEGKLGPMSGRLLTQEGQTYEITFVGAPTGTYEYFCVPHETLGMTATLVVGP